MAGGTPWGRSGGKRVNYEEMSQIFSSTPMPMGRGACPIHQNRRDCTQRCPRPPLSSGRPAMPFSPGFLSSTMMPTPGQTPRFAGVGYDSRVCDYPSVGTTQFEPSQAGPSAPVLNMQAEEGKVDTITQLLIYASAGLKLQPELGTQIVTNFINSMIKRPADRHDLYHNASDQERVEFLNLVGIFAAFKPVYSLPLEVPTTLFKPYTVCYQDDEWADETANIPNTTAGPSNVAEPSASAFVTPSNQGGMDTNRPPAAPQVGAAGLAYYTPGVTAPPQQQPQLPSNRGLRLRPRDPNVSPRPATNTPAQTEDTTEFTTEVTEEEESIGPWFSADLAHRMRGIVPIADPCGVYYLPSEANLTADESDIFEIRVPEVTILGMGEEGGSNFQTPSVAPQHSPTSMTLTSSLEVQRATEPDSGSPSGPIC